MILKHGQIECKHVSGMTYQEEMDYIVQSDKRNKYIRNLASNLNGNTLCLFQYVEKHGKDLYESIKQKATDKQVFYVYGGVDTEEREQIRRITEQEQDAVIVASYGTFSTGINIKNLHNVIFASPTKSRVRSLQSIGRGLRKSLNKSRVTIYDLVDDIKYKNKENYTLKHFKERLKIYVEEKFKFKMYDYDL